MSKIIICCRTSDALGISGRIFDCLVDRFGRNSIFLDDRNATDAPPDDRKSRELQDHVRSADVFLASVGRNWLNGIDDDGDPVRAEIRNALTAGVVVIPVLVNGAGMPAPDQLPADIRNFAFRNASRIDPGPDFDRHLDRLIHMVDTVIASINVKKGDPPSPSGGAEKRDGIEARPSGRAQPVPQRQDAAPIATAAPIFISYASKDRKIAETICQALESRGLQCWIAGRDVAGGDNYQAAIVHAIRKARIMVLVFTENANNSDEIKKEIALAGRSSLVVIPIRIEDVLPNDALDYELTTRQWIDFFGDWERAIDTLCRRASEIVRG
jgi:TIR domain